MADPALRVVADRDAARTALHPLRRRLLERLARPGSAASVARELDLPRQKVNYHLRLLERDGLVEQVEERGHGSCRERVLQATARSFVLDPAALGSAAPDPAEVRDRFSAAYLLAVAGRAVHEVAALDRAAREADKRLATLTLEAEVRFATPERQRAFADELAGALRELAARYHDADAEGGRAFRFFVGGHPRVDPPPAGGPSAAPHPDPPPPVPPSQETDP